MTWTKFGGDFTDDPALLSLARGVRLLHIEGIIWCNRHGTDGKIPTYALSRVTDEPDPDAGVQALVEVGKWRVCEPGWEIVDFLIDQPSAADVQRTQELTRQRQRRQRQHRGGDHSLCDVRYCHQSREASPVSNGVSHDTRTVPSRAVKAKGEGRAATAAAPQGSRRAAATNCDLCDEFGFTLDDNQLPTGRCNHQPPRPSTRGAKRVTMPGEWSA